MKEGGAVKRSQRRRNVVVRHAVRLTNHFENGGTVENAPTIDDTAKNIEAFKRRWQNSSGVKNAQHALRAAVKRNGGRK